MNNSVSILRAEAISASRVKVVPRGQMANQMFQYMAAQVLSDLIGETLPVAGIQLREFGLEQFPSASSPPRQCRPVVLRGHDFNLQDIARRLRADSSLCAEVHGWGCRLDHFAARRSTWQRLFTPVEPLTCPTFGPECLVVHVRGGDIFSGRFPDYVPLPPSLMVKSAQCCKFAEGLMSCWLYWCRR